MKLKKFLKWTMAVALVFGTASYVTGCKDDEPTTKVEDTQQYKIYQLAVEQGATELTYEEWLASIRGERGEKGEDGRTPIIVIGSNGNWFIDNVDTNVKAQGPAGETGATGEQGPQGEQGVAGEDGATWLSGTTAPANDIGKIGDFYLDTVSLAIYKKGETGWEKVVNTIQGEQGETGATGEQGPQGEQGVAGEDGTKWLTGEGAPTIADGINEGDFYFDTVNNDVYLYVDGSWTLEVDLPSEKTLELKEGLYVYNDDYGSVYEININASGELDSVTVITGDQSQNVTDYILSEIIEDYIKISMQTPGMEQAQIMYFYVGEEVDYKEGKATELVRFVHISEEDKYLIYGNYSINGISGQETITISGSKALYYGGNSRKQFNCTITDANIEEGYVDIKLTDGTIEMQVSLDIYSRYAYVLDNTLVVNSYENEYYPYYGDDILTINKNADNYQLSTREGVTIELNTYSFVDSQRYLYVYNDDRGVYYVLDVLSNIAFESPMQFDIFTEKQYIIIGNSVRYNLNENNQFEIFNTNEPIGIGNYQISYSGYEYIEIYNVESKENYSIRLDSIVKSETEENVYTAFDVIFESEVKLVFGEDADQNRTLQVVSSHVYNEAGLRAAIANGYEEIYLARDMQISSVITIENGKNVVINGNNEYTISASSDFVSTTITERAGDLYSLFYIPSNTTDTSLTLRNVNINGNQAARAITVFSGTVTIDNAIIINGINKGNCGRSGGVYISNNASFIMTSGAIRDNYSGLEESVAIDGSNYLLHYSADLWIGANATGSLIAINGGEVGMAFVNSNEYSANNPGSFTLNGGTINTLYVEWDEYSATFNYESGTVNNLYVAKEVYDTDGTTIIYGQTYEVVYLEEGSPAKTYYGGEDPTAE